MLLPTIVVCQENLNPKGPGPLFSFGQNIIKKQETYGLLSFGTYVDAQRTIAIQFVELLYGINNNFSIYIQAPIVLQDKSKSTTSQGLGNIILQAEYAFYKNIKQEFLYQLTGVTSILLPSATTKIPLIIATKSTSFFFGITQRLIIEPWLAYAECGELITTKKNNTKLGNYLFFDAGIGRGINDTENSYLGIVLEANGIYNRSGVTDGISIKKNFIFFLGPTVRWQNQVLVLQVGIQYPCIQTGFKQNEKSEYRALLSCALKF